MVVLLYRPLVCSAGCVSNPPALGGTRPQPRSLRAARHTRFCYFKRLTTPRRVCVRVPTEEVAAAFHACSRRVLFLDYGGTLIDLEGGSVTLVMLL